MKTKDSIYVRSWGEGNKIALLIHGLASSSTTWDRLAKDLVLKGYKVFAPDLRGHGKSPRSNKYSVDEWAQDLIDLNLSPDLIVGHSVGGLIAAKIQYQLNVKKIVLIDPVFRLPHGKIVLKTVQHFFARTMVTQHHNDARKCRTNKLPHKSNFSKWDKKTIKALVPSKKIIIKCLMGNREVLLMRAKKSFILPAYVMKKPFGVNIHLHAFTTGGHNIHAEMYETFWFKISEFLNFGQETKYELVTV